MGLFNLFRNTSSEVSESANGKQSWNPIRTEEDIEDLLKTSNSKTQVVLKHSNRCAISYFAMNSLNIPTVLESDEFDLHIIDVIRYRSTSMYFADKVGIQHESPQLFVIQDGEVIWHGSHNMVSAENLLEKVSSVQ